MIKANELTNGFFVRRISDGSVIKVECVTKKKVGYHTKPKESRMYYIPLSQIEPIPITEEILMKNGFELYVDNSVRTLWMQKDNEFGQEIYDVELEESNTEGMYFLRMRHHSDGGSVEIKKIVKFIHELQACLCISNLKEINKNLNP